MYTPEEFAAMDFHQLDETRNSHARLLAEAYVLGHTYALEIHGRFWTQVTAEYRRRAAETQAVLQRLQSESYPTPPVDPADATQCESCQ